LTADCKDCSSDRYRFFLFLGTGSLERVKVSGSNGGESPSGDAVETPVGEVLELEGLLDAVDDSANREGFLADWPDTEAGGPFAGGPDAGGTEGTEDKPSGWGDWGPGSIEPGDRSSDSRLA
jgi:hypothetical protein